MTYRKVLTLEDLVGCRAADSDKTLTEAVFNKLGVYTVPNGMNMAVGALYDGYVYLRLDSTGGGQIHGIARIKVSNPTEDQKIPVYEFDTRACSNANNKQEKPSVPLSLPWVKADSKIILEFKPHPAIYQSDGNAAGKLDCSDADNLLMLDVSYLLV